MRGGVGGGDGRVWGGGVEDMVERNRRVGKVGEEEVWLMVVFGGSEEFRVFSEMV